MNNKIINLCLLTFLLPLFCFAQGWERTYDTGVNETISAMDLTLDGGLILAGYSSGNPDDMNQAFLYKTDELGNVQWEYYDTTYISEFIVAQAVVATPEGNFLYSFEYDNFLSLAGSTTQLIAPDGSMIWEFDLANSLYLENVKKIIKTNDDAYILLGSNQNFDQSAGYAKIDGDGNIIWEFQYVDSSLDIIPIDITNTANGEYLLLCSIDDDTNQDVFIARIGADGTPLWQHTHDNYPVFENEYPRNVTELNNGKFIITGLHNSSFLNPDDPDQVVFTILTDSDGNQISITEYDDINLNAIARGLQSTSNGGYAIAGTSHEAAIPSDLFLIAFDSIGNELWRNNYGRSNTEDAYFLRSAPDKGFYIGGFTQNPNFTYDGYLVKTDSLGTSITNSLEGNVYFDENLNCNLETTEIGLAGWLVKATKGNIEYSIVSDSMGSYQMTIDTGTYIISSYPISEYWAICNNNATTNFTDFNQTINQDLGAQAIIDCPLLDVSIGTNFLRRCFDNTYYISYCNLGTSLAEDAYLELSLDPDMIYQNASIPLTNQTGDLLTFDLGDIPIGECGSFHVDVLLGDSTNCDSIPLGATHCVEAHIFPDSICVPPSSSWSGASIEVDAVCEGDSISFFIQNTGTAMTTTLDFIIIEDDVVLRTGDFELGPGGIESFKEATNGSFFRLEAEQEPNHPGMSMPNVSVEGCGDSNVMFSWGFTNIYPQDDANPFIDIDCRSNIGSYDPNDKTGFPLGRDDEHYIDPGQDLEYLIRFQNTGTDTAFTVVIRDTLSPHLDINSVRPGASSHSYDFDISANNILNFTFNNIMLPDSNVNLVESNGFVKFRVDQKPDLDLETEINNSAAIYFDFNQPVITNTTLHTIGKPLITAVTVNQIIGEKQSVRVYPNPFESVANFELQGISLTNGTFDLFDVTGRRLYRQNFSGDVFSFERNGLGKGIYFFKIEEAGKLIGSGKLVIE